MILNNTHIQGIFIYKDDVEFEKGDFVISGNSIYICTAGNPNSDNNTVLGKDPKTDSENFTIYLGGSLKNIDEYFTYIENPTADKEDKLLTADLLSEILNTYMLGFDEKGVIGEYIYSDTIGNGAITLSSGLQKFISGETNKILDTIIRSEELNNATLKISRGLEEIKDIFPAQYQEGTIAEEDLRYLILRQYTYTNSIPIPSSGEEGSSGDGETGEEVTTKSRLEELFPECFENTTPDPEPEDPTGNVEPDLSTYRLQELVDPVQGFTAYRYAKCDPETEEWEITPWKSDYDYDFIGSIRKLEEAYRQAIEDLKQEKENLKNYFRFKEIQIMKTTGEIVLQCSDPQGPNYIPVDSFRSQSCVITVITQLWDTNITISVDILDSYMQISPVITYNLTETSYLTVEPPEDVNSDEYDKQVTVRVNNGNITNIYYRERYS